MDLGISGRTALVHGAGGGLGGAIAMALAAEGVTVAEVRSSRWCRALDTARLAFPATAVVPEPTLDSFFDARSERDGRTEAVRALAAGWRDQPGALLLVTHQVNITALTGLVPAQGEVVVVRSEGDVVVVVGRDRP